MAVLIELRAEVVPDHDPDPSYLEQDGFEQRRAAYERGDFGYVGVRAVAVVRYERNHELRHAEQTLRSAGIWGIEDDGEALYLDEIYAEELRALRAVIEELGVRYNPQQFELAEQTGVAT